MTQIIPRSAASLASWQLSHGPSLPLNGQPCIQTDEGVAEGAKSIAIHVTLQPRERTLTDAEIDAAISRIVAEVSKKTGATLRS